MNSAVRCAQLKKLQQEVGGRRDAIAIAIAEMEEKAKVVKLSALCSRLSEFCPQLRECQRIAKAKLDDAGSKASMVSSMHSMHS